MQRNIWLLVLSLLVMVPVACQGNGPQLCDEGGTLFNDDFGPERNCGWATYSRSGATVSLEEGVLHVTTSQPGQIWWTNPGREFGDVIIAVDAHPLSGPEDNAFGIICRYQDSERYYVFLISSDGYYAIGKYTGGSNQITYLTGDGEYVESDAINTGLVANSLRASCVGNELTLSANGVLLETVTDDTFSSGDIGLAASTFESGTLDVQFDNVRVLQP